MIICQTGVRVLETQLVWKTQNALREGFQSQTVQFDVRMETDPQGGSVSGTNLWVVKLFGSTFPDGSGTRVREETLTLGPPNSGRGVQAGIRVTLSDIITSRSMLGLTCAEVPYICIEVQKNPNSDPDYSLSGDLMDCIDMPCRGEWFRELQNI